MENIVDFRYAVRDLEKKKRKKKRLMISTDSTSEQIYDAIKVLLLPGLQVSQPFCAAIRKACTKYKGMQH